MMHEFESCGLGTAPFVFIEKIDLGAVAAECQCCETPIRYQFFLRSADRKEFFVGSTCILKSEPQNSELAETVRKSIRETINERNREKREVARREIEEEKRKQRERVEREWREQIEAERRERERQIDSEIAEYRGRLVRVNSEPWRFNQYAAENIRTMINRLYLYKRGDSYSRSWWYPGIFARPRKQVVVENCYRRP